MKGNMMRAAVCIEYGPPETVRIKEIARLKPKAGELLIQVMAASVDSGDTRVRAFRFPAIFKPFARMMMGWDRPKRPVLGTSLAGQVVALGEGVQGYRVGDKVMAMTGFGFGFGAHAQYIALPATGCIAPMPEGASFEEAASLPFGGTTALHFLRKAGLSQGQRLLIWGASGAVGSLAVQIAAAQGAKVDAVSGAKNMDLVRTLGAQQVFDYAKDIARLPAQSYDIIFDAVGKADKAACKRALKPGGWMVSVAGMESAKELASDLKQLKALYEAGKLKPVIGQRFALDDIQAAHRYVDSGHKLGSAILSPMQ